MPYPKADKGLNLSDEEEKAIHDSWTVLAEDLRESGVRFFVYFFGLYPKYQPMFPGFAKIPLEELSGNKRLKAHGFTVMNSINGFIESMDDIEMLKELLLKTGANHARRKLTPEDFEVVKSSLLGWFKQELGDGFTPVVSSSWDKALTTIVSIIVQGLNDYNKEHNVA